MCATGNRAREVGPSVLMESRRLRCESSMLYMELVFALLGYGLALV